MVMKTKFLAYCMLFGLLTGSFAVQAQVQPQVRFEQASPAFNSKQSTSLTFEQYVAYDITKFVPYGINEQIGLFRTMAYDLNIEQLERQCPNNSFVQTAKGMRFQASGNFLEAKKYYELAASKGNAYAENRLGELYLLGWGVNKDIGKARYWLERSAKTGYYFAQTSLGVTYLDFELTPNNVGMDLRTGLLYSKGRLLGVQAGRNADFQKARYWLYHAIAQGDKHYALGIAEHFFGKQNFEIYSDIATSVREKRLSFEGVGVQSDIRVNKASCFVDKYPQSLVILKDSFPKRYMY